MNDETKALCGSPSRDWFKAWHKQLSPQLYGCDIDFAIIAKDPPDIVAILDFKNGGDPVTFTEVIAYNALLIRGIRVFLVHGWKGSEKFFIKEYLGGHHREPRCTLGPVIEITGRAEFEKWERQLRDSHAQRWKP